MVLLGLFLSVLRSLLSFEILRYNNFDVMCQTSSFTSFFIKASVLMRAQTVAKIAVPMLPVAGQIQFQTSLQIELKQQVQDSFLSDCEDDEEYDDNVRAAIVREAKLEKQREIEDERKLSEKLQTPVQYAPGKYTSYRGKYVRRHFERRQFRQWHRRYMSQSISKHVSDEEYMANIRSSVQREPCTPGTYKAPRMYVYQPNRGATIEERYRDFCEYCDHQELALEEWRRGDQDPRERPFVPIRKTFEQFKNEGGF